MRQLMAHGHTALGPSKTRPAARTHYNTIKRPALTRHSRRVIMQLITRVYKLGVTRQASQTSGGKQTV